MKIILSGFLFLAAFSFISIGQARADEWKIFMACQTSDGGRFAIEGYNYNERWFMVHDQNDIVIYRFYKPQGVNDNAWYGFGSGGGDHDDRFSITLKSGSDGRTQATGWYRVRDYYGHVNVEGNLSGTCDTP